MTSTRRTLMVLGTLLAVLAVSTGAAQAQPAAPTGVTAPANGYGAFNVTIRAAAGTLATDDFEVRYEELASGVDFTGVGDKIVTIDAAGPGAIDTVYRLSGLKHGTRYAITARVKRVASGVTTYSDWATGVGSTTLVAPALGQVKGLTLEALDGGLKATWTAIADPVGFPIARYRVDVSASPSGGSFSSQMWVDGAMTEAMVMNLMNGVEYTVTVRAQASMADGMPDTNRDLGPASESKKVTPMAGAGGTDPEPDPDPMPTPTPAVPLVGILALFAGLLAAGRARLRR